MLFAKVCTCIALEKEVDFLKKKQKMYRVVLLLLCRVPALFDRNGVMLHLFRAKNTSRLPTAGEEKFFRLALQDKNLLCELICKNASF